VRSGLLGPQLEHMPAWGSNVEATPGGTLVAERLVPIRNEGMLPVDLQKPALPSIDELDAPEVDLSRLEDLQGTLELLREVGALA